MRRFSFAGSSAPNSALSCWTTTASAPLSASSMVAARRKFARSWAEGRRAASSRPRGRPPPPARAAPWPGGGGAAGRAALAHVVRAGLEGEPEDRDALAGEVTELLLKHARHLLGLALIDLA